ncbi:hypothetical protein [Paraflavitalea speifideaquila]|uniref:hypothetical protein n=1 Tax=Paraflavitalea speifideaquila TaxID=3076558 RepID=UPI0028E6ECF5|nr:hypothetical protein [Paraflavitalea speifideiaquila]
MLRDYNNVLIAGESKDRHHLNEIEALSFDQDPGNNSLFVFTMVPNKVFKVLREALFSKRPFKSADIVVRKNGAVQNAEFYMVRLMEPQIVELTDHFKNAADPVIKVVLKSTLAAWQYTPLTPEGTLGTPYSFGWDMALNRLWSGAFGPASATNTPTSENTTLPPNNTTVDPGTTLPPKVTSPKQEPIYTDNFQKTKNGEFPAGWLTNGSGQVATVKGQSGQWLEMVQGYVYTPELKNELPNSFTLDFDIVFRESKTQRTNFYLRFLSLKNKEQFTPEGPYTDLSFIGYNSLAIRNSAGNIQSTRSMVQDSLSGKVTVSITKTQRKFILVLNGKKMFDIPAFFGEANYNTVQWIAELAEDSRAYIANIRIRKID